MPDYKKAMINARKRIASMQRAESEVGFQTAEDSGPFQLLRTVFFAIEAGISTDDWGCVAEAQVMLETALKQIEEGGCEKP